MIGDDKCVQIISLIVNTKCKIINKLEALTRIYEDFAALNPEVSKIKEDVDELLTHWKT